MFLIVGTIRLPPANMELARAAMERMILASRLEPGCEQYGYAEDVLEPGLIHVKEAWQSQDHLERHFASRHIAAWRATWPALGITDRSLTLYRAGNGTPV